VFILYDYMCVCVYGDGVENAGPEGLVGNACGHVCTYK